MALARAMARHERVGDEQLFHGAAEGARALAVDDAHLGEAGQERVVQVFLEQVAGLVGGAPDEVDLRRDASGPQSPTTIGSR